MRRVLEEAFGQGKVEIVDEIADANVVCYDPNSETGVNRGPEAIKGAIGWLRAAFPDLTFTVEEQTADGEKVTSRWTMEGTQEGEFFGPPTGRRVRMMGMQIDRFEGGKLVEEWASYDMLGALRQLGAIPEPQQEAGS
jgi:predicted ester cyclase